MDKLVKIKIKFTSVIQAIEEVDRFVGEDMPEDNHNQLASEYKQALRNEPANCNQTCSLLVMSYQQ